MPPTHLSQLFSRYLAAVATEEEKQELFRLSLDVNNRAELDQLLKDFVEREGEDSLVLAPENVEPLYQNILARAAVKSSPETADKTDTVDKLISLPVHRRLQVFRRAWFRISAAAAILIAVSFGTWFLIKNQKPVQPSISVTPLKTDVAPGGNKAILTLSNGSQIILDSAQNGVLAKQGNVNVTKTDSGRLAYNASTEKPGNTANPSINSTPSEISYNTLSTPRGGQYQLTLPDGTKVWLNSASSITYPTAFTGTDRKVEITGEVYFEVLHNSKTPFRVKANDQTIEDLGTAFNINAYTDEGSIKTTLLEGSVKVSKGYETVLLKPGQQSRTTISGQLTANSNINVEEITAWRSGYFHFESADLKTILRQFARWYNIEVIYEGSVSDEKYFTIVPRNKTLSSVLKLLGANGIHFRIEGEKLYVGKN